MTYKLSKPPRDSTWLEYHRTMTEKHRYFVRGDGLEPFYTDENIESIRDLVGVYIDVFDCGWTRDKWDGQPYKYRFVSNGNKYEFYAHPSTLKPNHGSYRPAGAKLNGEWFELRYYDTAGDQFTSFFWAKDGYCLINHGGKSLLRSESGKWFARNAGGTAEVDRAPTIELLPQARRINAGKWRGFYTPIIEFLVAEGMNRTQL